MPTASSEELVIRNFQVGIGPSPHQGFGDMRNLDVSTRPGITRLNYISKKSSGTAIADMPVKIVRDPLSSGGTKFFALDSSGTLYRSDDSGATWYALPGAPTAGIDIIIWQDYLFLAKAATLNTYGSLNNTPTATWQTSWQTFGAPDNAYHPMIQSVNDGKLYGGSSHYIFSVNLTNTTGLFSPTGGAISYVYTDQALDVIGNDQTGYVYRIKCLEELGNNLVIGTDLIRNNIDREFPQDGIIFPWDRASSSFGQPTIFNMNGINQMKNINNTLYVQAGLNGKYYRMNGGQYIPIAEIPNYISNMDAGKFLLNNCYAIQQQDNKLFFGISAGATATDIGGIGVWSFNPATGALVFEHTISTGNSGADSTVKIGALLPFSRDRMMIGWKDGATAGIDITGTARATDYVGYFESPLYKVGTILNKRVYTQVEFQLVEPLASGQGVKIKYRTDLSAAFTTIGTYDFATLGAVISHNAAADIPACEFIQLRVELTTGSETNASPQLRDITLR